MSQTTHAVTREVAPHLTQKRVAVVLFLIPLLLQLLYTPILTLIEPDLQLQGVNRDHLLIQGFAAVQIAFILAALYTLRPTLTWVVRIGCNLFIGATWLNLAITLGRCFIYPRMWDQNLYLAQEESLSLFLQICWAVVRVVNILLFLAAAFHLFNMGLRSAFLLILSFTFTLITMVGYRLVGCFVEFESLLTIFIVINHYMLYIKGLLLTAGTLLLLSEDIIYRGADEAPKGRLSLNVHTINFTVIAAVVAVASLLICLLLVALQA